MENTTDTAAVLSKQLTALVDDAQMATLAAAFQAYRSEPSVKNLCDAIPDVQQRRHHFSTGSPAFLSSIPPHTCQAICSTWCSFPIGC